jgi:hypothetical protein
LQQVYFPGDLLPRIAEGCYSHPHRNCDQP